MKANSKSKSQASRLPTGLWVGLIRRPKSQWEVPEVPEYYEEYYYRIRTKRMEKQVLKVMKGVVTKSEAVRIGRMYWEAAQLNLHEAVGRAVAAASVRREFASLGAIFTAFKSEGTMIMREVRRPVSALRLMVARVKGWHVVGSRIDEGKALANKIDALSSGDVLTKDFVREFYRVMQGGVMNVDTATRENLSINSQLINARVLFSKKSLAYKLEGLKLPDLRGFLGEPLLPVLRPDMDEELILPEQFKRMLEAARVLEKSGDARERELALVNECLRKLGLRSGELCAARGTWLKQGRDGRWVLEVKDRLEEGFQMKGVEPGCIPLDARLTAVLVGRKAVDDMGFLILPEGTVNERAHLIRDEHNPWLKGYIGEIKSGKGNHRMRNYMATLLCEQYGVAVAAAYLRHSKEATTLKNYVARRAVKLPVVNDEDIRTWGEVVG